MFWSLLSTAAATEAGRPEGTHSRHWAFQPVRSVPLPTVRHTSWIQSPIDAFVLAKLEAEGLEPSRPADRRTLLRRATYDLTGLPPTPEDLDRFLADEAPDAFARAVDRLLASPAYGERWARHWLDVVRYADARDLIQLPPDSDFREAWRYRDWVTRAHNADLPFGEFVRRQIAGDLLQPDRPEAIDEDAWVATGLLAIADFVPGAVDKDQMIADYVNDQIDVVGRAFLGLTLSCARCHDHKSDPVTMQDYYGMAGIFFSTRLIPSPVKGNTPLVRVPLLSRAELERIENLRKRIVELDGAVQQASRERDRHCLDELATLAVTQSGRYLQALAELREVGRQSDRTNLTAFAAAHDLVPGFLQRWADRVTNGAPHPDASRFAEVPGWTTLLRGASTGETSPGEIRTAALALESALRQAHQKSVEAEHAGPDQPEWARSELARLQASAARVLTDREGRVIHWTSRPRGPRGVAAPAANLPGPLWTNVVLAGHAQPVLRFTGKELMETAVPLPTTGSVFVVFRRADREAEGQRLIGWEDSDAGRHGLGLMLKRGGGLHLIARADAANGDLVAGASTNADFEIVGITWGPGGTTLRRQGRVEGRNAALSRVSADPGIPMLRIGGPGSGGAARFAGDLAELRVYSAPLDDVACAVIESELEETWGPKSALSAVAVDPAEQLLEVLASPTGPFWLPEAEREPRLPEALRARLRSARADLASAQASLPREIPQAVVVRDGGPAETPHAGFHDAVMYVRGDPKRPGPRVPRGFPAIIAKHQPDPAQLTQTSGRRQMADWLASPDNPLTARVAANRIWQHHFGEGIVRTAANFGVNGERPTHPELLDYLAARFLESGGSAKALHRLLLLSATYQQSSEPSSAAAMRDPENRLLSHAHARRLEAEAIRDSLLKVAGGLDATVGGPAVTDVAQPRRSLYLMAVRTGAKSGFASLFDAPDCGAIVERRNVSISAPQALFLLNDAFTTEQSRRLAARLKRHSGVESHTDLVRRVYREIFGRAPQPEELQIGRALLRESSEGDPLERYCQMLFCTNEFIHLD